MQGSARQDTHCFLLSFDRSSDFSVDRRLDVSFVLDGLVGKIWVMMDWELFGYTGLGVCLRTSQWSMLAC
jgi:hypothetical protein